MKLYYRILKIYELKRKNRMEKRDLYNSDRIKTGETIFKGEDIPKDRYILVVLVFIENSEGG